MNTCMGKILIVDDFKPNIEFIQNILINEGYEIYSCDNTDLSLEIIFNIKFDLILLDIVMPKTDGYTVCKQIRKSELNSETPVIFITTKKDENSIIKGFEIGAQDFIIRPFFSKELLARVNTHVELKKHREELENNNKNLEDIIKIRTQELHSALIKLKNSYRKLKRAQIELESLDKAKENFLEIISHEIRTPLNGILGFSELLKQKCKDEKYIDCLNMMHESVKRLEKFSMKALLITQLKTGRYQPEYSRINLGHHIYEVANSMEIPIKKNNLTVHYMISDIELNADSYLLTNVLNNLLENAVYYSPRNGLIRIIVEKVSDCYCQLLISDEGNGFPESVLHDKSKIFFNDNFIDNNPGLGIFTTYLIIKTLKGNLILKNNSKRGATAIVRLRLQ